MRRGRFILFFLINLAFTTVLLAPNGRSVEASGRTWSETRYAGLLQFAWVNGTVGAQTTIEWHLSPWRCAATFSLIDLSWLAFAFFARGLWRLPSRAL